jgi:hypothetical protein
MNAVESATSEIASCCSRSTLAAAHHRVIRLKWWLATGMNVEHSEQVCCCCCCAAASATVHTAQDATTPDDSGANVSCELQQISLQYILLLLLLLLLNRCT